MPLAEVTLQVKVTPAVSAVTVADVAARAAEDDFPCVDPAHLHVAGVPALIAHRAGDHRCHRVGGVRSMFTGGVGSSPSSRQRRSLSRWP